MANKDTNTAKSLIFRQIELNWINAPLEDDNDYIGLYLDSQPDDNTLPVSIHRLNGQTSGQIITDYYLPPIDFYNETRNNQENREQLSALHQSLDSFNQAKNVTISRLREAGNSNWFRSSTRTNVSPNHKLIDECIGYCLAYHSRNKIYARNCLKTNPNWMLDTFQYIGSRSLPSIMIPGTHNSGTYPKQLDQTALHMINKYQMNQDESIFNQLMFGVRHLDLRVGYTKVKQRPEKLWIYHDIFRTEVSVDEILEQVKRFLDLTSHEIVIVDFHRFTVGFQNENIMVQKERHAKLIDLIFKQLGNYIVPSYLGLHAPISEYISIGKRVIVGYANRGIILDLQNDQQSTFARLSYQVKSLPQIIHGDVPTMRYNGNQTLVNNTTSSEDLLSNTGTKLSSRHKLLKSISDTFTKRSIGISKKNNSITSQPSMKLISFEDNNNNPDQIEIISLSKATLFFSPIRHLWPNKDSIEGLAQYMNETTCRKYFGELSSMMAELTPTVFGVIADKYDGNRKLAQQVNRPITDWLRERWLHCVNIIATDFFLGNDLIRLSIYANKMRVLHRDVDLNSYGECKNFRQVEHLLDKSKIPIQFTYALHNQIPQTSSIDGIYVKNRRDKDSEFISHTSSNGNQIFLKPLAPSFNSQTIGRERRESFVENVSDGFSNLVSSFKRLLSL